MGSIYNRPGVNATDKAKWNDTTNQVTVNSSYWDSAYASVCSLSGVWSGAAGLWVSGFDGVLTTATLSAQFDIALLPTLSASGIIYSGCGNSEQWCSTYSSVNNTSGSWDSVYTNVNDNSGNWDSTYLSFESVSASWNTAYEILSGGDYAPADSLAVNYGTQVNFTPTSNTVSGYYDGIDKELGNINDDINFIGSASAFFAEQDWVHSNFVNITGDTMQGSLDFNGWNATGINTLCATALYTISSYTHYQDIQVSELSGFSVTGDVDIDGVVYVSGSVITPCGNSDEWCATTDLVNASSDSWNEAYYEISGGLYIEADSVEVLYTPINYSVTSTNVSGHLEGIDNTINNRTISGSIVTNIGEFSIDPLSGELITGDIWITDSPSTSGKLLKYWDGTYKYSVELSKE